MLIKATCEREIIKLFKVTKYKGFYSFQLEKNTKRKVLKLNTFYLVEKNGSFSCSVDRKLGSSMTIYCTFHKHANSKGRYTLGDKSQQHVAATSCIDKSLSVYWRIFVKIFVAATEFVAATSRTDSV